MEQQQKKLHRLLLVVDTKKFLAVKYIQVQVGDMVEAGQIIGLVGNTGRGTGAHLHWELWVNGVQVDPLDWLQQEYP